MQLLDQDENGTWVWNPLTRATYGQWQVGTTFPAHSHESAAEFFVFIEGRCELICDGRTHVMSAGQAVYVGPGEVHELTVVGDRPLVLFMFVVPNQSPTHTFYAADGTPVHWDRPPPGASNPQPYGPSREEIEQMVSERA